MACDHPNLSRACWSCSTDVWWWIASSVSPWRIKGQADSFTHSSKMGMHRTSNLLWIRRWGLLVTLVWKGFMNSAHFQLGCGHPTSPDCPNQNVSWKYGQRGDKSPNCRHSVAGQHVFQQLKTAWMLRDHLWETIHQIDVATISICLRLQKSTFVILKSLLPFLLLIIILDK